MRRTLQRPKENSKDERNNIQPALEKACALNAILESKSKSGENIESGRHLTAGVKRMKTAPLNVPLLLPPLLNKISVKIDRFSFGIR